MSLGIKSLESKIKSQKVLRAGSILSMFLLCSVTVLAEAPMQSVAPQFVTGKLTHLVRGDVACYVTLQHQGSSIDYYSDFDVCEHSGWIGENVKAYRRKALILADVCEGNPDCSETKAVNLVYQLALFTEKTPETIPKTVPKTVPKTAPKATPKTTPETIQPR
tara:strand:- start:164 stop:652 length:489 start_codon:yes stop_codon:yes gene_type:complete